MNLEMIQYIQINCIGIAILCVMLFYVTVIGSEGENEGKNILVRMLISNIIILASDIGIYLFRNHEEDVFIYCNHAVCILYFVMQIYFSYLWAMYSIKMLYPEFASKKLKYLMLIPLAVVSVIIILSPQTKMIYYLTEENRHMRGDYLFVMTIAAYAYWIFSMFLTVREMIKQKRVRERGIYVTLLIFPLPTLIGNILQIKFYGLSIVWICATLSLLILFINMQSYQLSRDILTGLFNRRQTNKYIIRVIKRFAGTDCLLFAIVTDVDHFKEINDLYGHTVGDKALISVSHILKNSCRERDFVARFSGDEFIIIGYVRKEEEVKEIIDNTNRAVELFNKSNNAEYKISLSMGYHIYKKGDSLSADSLISDADNAMYKVKKVKAESCR